MQDKIKISKALISVYDKTDLISLAKVLSDKSVEIISTGGTARFLREKGFTVTNVSDITQFPEILGGRVKTLHPMIHGAILAKREDDGQMKELAEKGIRPIDMVIVNLYPFEQTVVKPDVTREEALENIDIGGPCMIRAAAKNYPSVAVVTDPSQYESIITELKENGGMLTIKTRERLSGEAFLRTRNYDAAIQSYLMMDRQIPKYPEFFNISLKKVQDLRYGENPHQSAVFYAAADDVKFGEQLHGKELSFNNILDIHSAISLAAEFEEPCAVILKHNNPCGAAVHDDLLTAYTKALETDPVSAFGGVVAFNRTVASPVAEKLSEIFLEVIIAPDFNEDAQTILTKKKNIRLITWPGYQQKAGDVDIKKVAGGYLLQSADIEPSDAPVFRVVTKRQPTDDEWRAMRFGWKVGKWVKSNAVVFVNAYQTLGIGAGQMSRVDSSKLAVMKAKNANLDLTGSVAISDAFFPFRDGVDAAAEAGARAVIQPGGSVRDKEVIAAADEHDMAMVFTGIRHFRH